MSIENMTLSPVQKPLGVTTALAQAEQSRAVQEVQAALIIAKSFPRDEKSAIDEILNACTSPKLAETAVYQFARGGQNIEGPSIRLAETLAQYWGNFVSGFRVVSKHTGEDGVQTSEVEAYAWDQQRNTRKTMQFHVKHWRDTKSGGYAIKEERDIYELIANQAQRRVRACILAVIPSHVVEMALEQVQTTQHSTADTSPEAQKKIIAAFEKVGVSQELIEKKIQRRIDAITPAQVVNLRKILASIKDGIGKPADFFEVKESSTAPVIDVPATPAAPRKAPARKAASPQQDEPSPKQEAFWKRCEEMNFTRDEVSGYLSENGLTPDTITPEQQEEMEKVLFDL